MGVGDGSIPTVTWRQTLAQQARRDAWWTPPSSPKSEMARTDKQKSSLCFMCGGFSFSSQASKRAPLWCEDTRGIIPFYRCGHTTSGPDCGKIISVGGYYCASCLQGSETCPQLSHHFHFRARERLLLRSAAPPPRYAVRFFRRYNEKADVWSFIIILW